MGLFIKSKKQKQEEAELKEYLDELERIEEEVKKEEDKKFNIVALFEKDPLEEELRQYMTEEQLQEEAKIKKTNKTLTLIGVPILAAIMIAVTVIIIVVNHNLQDDLHKIYIKDLRDYYNNKYNTRTSIEDIQYICYTDQDKNNVCTDIIYAHTKDDKVVIKRGDEYGDNNSLSSYYKDYNEDLLSVLSNGQLILNKPSLSYTNFYNVYYQYIDYIQVLPNNKTYKELLDSKTLTLRDIIIYQNDIDINAIYTFLNRFSENSQIVLIRLNKGSPTNVKVVSKHYIDDIDVIGQLNLLDDNIYYQLDANKNNTSSIELTKVSTTAIKPLVDGSTFSNPYIIKIEKHRSTNEFNRDNLPSYYLLLFNNLKEENMIQFNSSQELPKESYKYYYYITISDKTYVFANQDMGIANISYNKKK